MPWPELAQRRVSTAHDFFCNAGDPSGHPQSVTHRNRHFSLLALVLASLLLPPSQAPAQAQPRTARALVLLLSGDTLRPELVEALRVEALSNGYGLVLGEPPAGDTGLQRAAAAQTRGSLTGARATLWLEQEADDAGGGVVVRALAAGVDDTRYAPLPAPLADVAPRTFAVVAGSLLDELEQPPVRTPTRVRVRVEVDIDTDEEPLTSAELSLGPDEGSVVAVSGGLAPDGALAPDAAQPVEPAPADASPTQPLVEAPQEAPLVVVETAPIAETDTAAGAEESADTSEDGTSNAAQAPDGLFDQAAPDLPPDPLVVPFGADVVPFVGTSSRSRGRAIRHYSLNLLGGIDQELRGVEASLGFGMYRGDVTGVQLAGGFTYAGGNVRGLQLGAGANLAGGDVTGVQATGGLNYAGGDVTGLQVGTVNIARGVVDGVQVGLVNYSDDVDFALGLVNIVRSGRTHLELTGSSDGTFALSLKHGGRHFHYIYSALTRPDGADATLIGAGLGLGARVTLGERVFIDLDTLGYGVRARSELFENGDVDALLVTRVLLGVRLFSRLSLVAGASYSGLWSRSPAPDYGLFGTRHHAEPVEGRHLSSWPSVLVGLQVL